MNGYNDNADLDKVPTKPVSIWVYFYGRPGDPQDRIVEAMAERFAGTVTGSGTNLMNGERDVSVDLHPQYVAAFKRELEALSGFRIELPDEGDRPAA